MPEARLETGIEAHRAGRLGEAEAHYLALLAAGPDHQVLRLLGLLRRSQGRLAEAIALLARAAGLMKLPQVFAELAEVLAAAGEVTEAAEAFARARPEPGGGERHPLIRALIAQGTEHYHAGRNGDAIGLFRLALVLDPRPEVARGLAACLLIESNTAANDRAADLCRIAARLHPVSQAHSKLCALLYPASPSEAALHGVRAFQLDPTAANLETAMTVLVRLVTSGRTAPEGLPAYVYALGETNYHRQSGDPAKALACGRRAAALSPELPFAHARLGHLAASAGRLDEANAHLRRADRHGPARENVMRLGTAFLSRLEAAPPPDLAIDGTLAATDAPLVIVSSCDGGYLDRFGENFAKTLAAAAGMPFHLHLHLIGADARRAADLARRAGVAALTCTVQRDRAPSGGKERGTYYACQRFLLLPRLLRHYRAPVLQLDIDLLVQRPLRLLLDMAGGADLAAVGGPHLEPWNQLWADVLLFRPTPATLRFVDLAARYIGHFLNAGSPRWFLDQIALAAAWRWLEARGTPLNLTFLPSTIHRDGLDQGDQRAAECLFWSIRASLER